MTKKEKIEQEVQKTMDSFDKAERLKSDPFFYTRLKAQIDDLNAEKSKVEGWKFAWAILKPALLFFIIGLNIVTAMLFLKNRNASYSSREQLLNAFAQELTLDSNQYNPNLLINK